MDITVFDLLLIIKDTEKPLILTHDAHYERYNYRELALDTDKIALPVAGVRVEAIEGRPSYLIKVRG